MNIIRSVYRSYSNKLWEGKNVTVQPDNNIFKSTASLFNCWYTCHALHPNCKHTNHVYKVT